MRVAAPPRLAPLCLALLLLLGACAPRASVEIVRADPGIGTEMPVYVGTTRREVAPGTFSRTERGALTLGRFTVSIPPAHETGQLSLARGTPDPALHFVTRDVERLDSAAFRADLRRALAARPEGDGARNVVLFVHGFNNVLGDGLYRIAQISHDLALPAVSAHYAWPSAGNPLGYVRDRDSALFAREGLLDLLDEIAAGGAREITIVAHSMGAFLTMEALILAERDRVRPGVARIGGVVLLSPDIDVELFRQQAATLTALPRPFYIFTSERDRALRLSARLTGETDRLGSLREISRISDLEVAVVNVSNLTDTGSSHLAAVTSPTMLRVLTQARNVDRAFSRDAGSRLGILPGTVLSVREATEVIVDPASLLAPGP